MSAKLKNILIMVVVVALLLLAYFLFFNKKEAPLLTGSEKEVSGVGLSNQDKDLLSILLNMKNIEIDNSLFTNSTFSSLKDTSIELIPDGKEGRVNPFAPIGSDEEEVLVVDTLSLEDKNTNTENTSITDLNNNTKNTIPKIDANKDSPKIN